MTLSLCYKKVPSVSCMTLSNNTGVWYFVGDQSDGWVSNLHPNTSTAKRYVASRGYR